MFTSGRTTMILALASALLCAAPFASGEPQKAIPAAPVPSQILAGKKVFISNAGLNLFTLRAYITSHTGSPNGFYDQFYAAVHSLGKYEVVSIPANADLVFQIFLYARDYSVDPQFELRILDPKTGIVLWAFAETVPAGSGREASRRKAWDAALEKLINDVKTLSVGSPSSAEPQTK
jgi:hypothetical protein